MKKKVKKDISRSPTRTANHCDFTPPIRAQTSEQEYSDLINKQGAANTVLLQHSPKNYDYQRDHAHALFHVDKTCVEIFGLFRNFSKICWKVKMWSVVLRMGRTPQWMFCANIAQHLFSRH